MKEVYIDRIEKTPLGSLLSGEMVVDRVLSHAKDHGIEYDVLREVLQKIDAKQRLFVLETVTLANSVGDCNCVETQLGDEIVYAQRLGRKGMTRFVKNRLPTPSNQVTVVLRWDKNLKQYECVTAYVGPQAHVEPFDSRADDAAREFWQNHALVWGSQEIDEDTITETPQ
jgi:hypothetical protein